MERLPPHSATTPLSVMPHQLRSMLSRARQWDAISRRAASVTTWQHRRFRDRSVTPQPVSMLPRPPGVTPWHFSSDIEAVARRPITPSASSQTLDPAKSTAVQSDVSAAIRRSKRHTPPHRNFSRCVRLSRMWTNSSSGSVSNGPPPCSPEAELLCFAGETRCRLGDASGVLILIAEHPWCKYL